jgi:regulator of sigma E protease
MISQVLPNSPAALADLSTGEVVYKIDEIEIKQSSEFVELIKARKGTNVSLWVTTVDANGERSGESRVVTVVPRENPPEGEGALGVAVSTMPIFKYEKLPWYQAPITGTVEGVKEAIGWSREFLRIFMHPAELIKNVGGPVQVVKVGQQAVAAGWEVTLRFVGIISLNLAIFNLLPFPALDGGRLLMVGLEKVVGRKRVDPVSLMNWGGPTPQIYKLVFCPQWSSIQILNKNP